MLKYVNKYLLTGSINISNTIPSRCDLKEKVKTLCIEQLMQEKSINVIIYLIGEKIR